MVRLTSTQWGKVLYELTKDVKSNSKELDRAIALFGDMLQKNYVLKRIDAIIEAYEAYAKKQAGIKELVITAARKLNVDEIKDIEKHFGDTVESTVVVDQGIIGGVVVRNGNTILNGSIANQLEQLKHCL